MKRIDNKEFVMLINFEPVLKKKITPKTLYILFIVMKVTVLTSTQRSKKTSKPQTCTRGKCLICTMLATLIVFLFCDVFDASVLVFLSFWCVTTDDVQALS